MNIKLVGVYVSVIHLQVFYNGVHEIYTPPIKQSDWSEVTSHGTRKRILTTRESLLGESSDKSA